MKWVNDAFFLVVLGAAIWLRVTALDTLPLWVDEAESSINALTILEHGLPVDSYLGLPIYENTLLQPWPESDEYEFRDSSYSSRGLAIYHGWLPLYAMAASLAVNGIKPDHARSGLSIQHGPEERLRRTVAPRIPSVVFGLIGLIALYWAGMAIGGKDVAWAALVTGAFATSNIEIDHQARYYAAMVAISTVCCLTIWKVLTRAGWRWVLACALSLSLLFYTHLMTFVSHSAALAMMACVMFLRRRCPADALRFGVLGSMVATLTLPWLVATDFLAQKSMIPRAWPLLRFPRDLLSYPLSKSGHAVLFAIGLVIFLLARYGSAYLPRRVTKPWQDLLVPAIYLGALLIVGYCAFLYFIPAASLFWTRMSLILMGPGFLLDALLLAGVARMLTQRHSDKVAPLIVLGFLLLTGRLLPNNSRANRLDRWRDVNQLIDALGQQPFAPEARIFSSPNDHLVLTYLTGLPVQSIAPVRKTFLDQYPGEIVFAQHIDDLADDDDPLGWRGVQAAARKAGEILTEQQAIAWSEQLATQQYRGNLAQRVKHVWPELEVTPTWALDRLDAQSRTRSQKSERMAQEIRMIPIFDGYEIGRWDEWWPVFFYRFVNPNGRRGDQANYTERMRNANAMLVPRCTWVLFRSPAPASPAGTGSE